MSVYERLDEAIAYLNLVLGVQVVQVKKEPEIVEYLHAVTRTLAHSVYKKSTHLLDCIKK